MANTRDFHKGYEELYLYKFKKYLASASRYVRDKQLKTIHYHGDN